MILKISKIKIIPFLILAICVETNAQKISIMASYSQADLFYSPGLEANYFFNEKLGLELGFSTFLFNYKPNQMVNQAPTEFYNKFFYNGNIGLCGDFLNYKMFKLRWTGGLKIYHGPDFIPLHFYEEGGYFIYFDSSGTDLVGNKFDQGLDLGLLFHLYKLIIGLKYDTARYQKRFLIGWSF